MKKENKNEKPGNGQQFHFKAEIKGSVKIGEEKETQFNINYEVNITVEQVEYAVRQIAGTIARVASKIAEPAGPAATPVAATAAE